MAQLRDMRRACQRMFNRAQERDPQRLLRPLTKLLQDRSVSVQHALFVPPDSSYSSLGPRAGPPDLSWQEAMQHVWDSELASGLTQVCCNHHMHSPSASALGAISHCLVFPIRKWHHTCVN